MLLLGEEREKRVGRVESGACGTVWHPVWHGTAVARWPGQKRERGRERARGGGGGGESERNGMRWGFCNTFD
jgi:hypothetical protein